MLLLEEGAVGLEVIEGLATQELCLREEQELLVVVVAVLGEILLELAPEAAEEVE